MAQKIINTKIQEAYDTEANWIKYNPVLLAGQLAFSKDKYGKYKIGDGIAKWSQLQYMTLGWNDITGKPSSFTPSSHAHDDRYFTETEATNKFSPKEGSASLSKLASTITLGAGDAATILQNGSTYQQKIEIIDNSTSGDAVFGFYQSGDSGKNFNKLMTINDDGNVVANKFTGALAGNASSASSVPWSGVSGKPSTFPPSTHNHPASQITGLPTKLPNPYALTVKGNGALLNTYDGSGAKEINITPAEIGAATSGHTHNYAGSSSAGGAANSANMLNANAGSSTQPVYFSGGKPVACAYTLGKSVPSNAVFTDTNTWRPVQNNLTSTSTTDSLSANQGRILKGLIDSKAPSSHTHSYLPLSGGTLTGRLTANGRIYATTVGGGWVSGMTPTNATLGISTQNSNSSYHPIISCKTYNSHVWNLGTITDTVGFYGFKKGRTDNGTDWAFTINVTNGAVNSTGNISAPAFYGRLCGTADTANSVAWNNVSGKPSTFTPSSHSHTIANITNLQSALDGKASTSHTHEFYATTKHTHNTINDLMSGNPIGISTSTYTTPAAAGEYDIVVANTSKIGNNKCVVMSKVSFVEHVKNHIIETFPLKAITNSQIDSLASL